MTSMQIPTVELEVPRCVHGLSGPCNGRKLKRKYCKTLFVVRRWFLTANNSGWNQFMVAGMWCMIVAFTTLMAAAVISIQSIAKPSTTEERIATMITNCQIQSGQTCELIMDAKPIVTSNIRF